MRRTTSGNRFLFVTIAALVCSSANGQTIRAWSTGQVRGDTVLVRDACDLSELAGEVRSRVGKARLGPAPLPGQTRNYPLSEIRTAISRAGLSPAKFRLMGSTHCSVTRLADIAGTQKPTGQPRRPSPDQKMALDGKVSLKDMIQSWLSNDIGARGGTAVLSFEGNDVFKVNLTGSPDAFELVRSTGPRLGQRNLLVRVPDINQGGKRELWIRVRVAAVFAVVVPRQPLNLLDVVARDDVELMDLTFDKWPESEATSIDQVVGRRVKRFVRKGEPIRQSDLEEIPLVVRNQWVRLITVVGSVRGEIAAKSLASGMEGDSVRVRFNGREELVGTVTGPGEVTIMGGA